MMCSLLQLHLTMVSQLTRHLPRQWRQWGHQCVTVSTFFLLFLSVLFAASAGVFLMSCVFVCVCVSRFKQAAIRWPRWHPSACKKSSPLSTAGRRSLKLVQTHTPTTQVPAPPSPSLLLLTKVLSWFTSDFSFARDASDYVSRSPPLQRLCDV